MTDQHHSFEVHPRSEGMRLDQYLVGRLPELSRAYVQKLVDDGRASVAGAAMRRSYRVRAYETVEFHVPAPSTLDLTPEAIPLQVAYEDKHLLVVDKPAGMVVHPTLNDRAGTLVHALLHHCQGQLSGINGVERPGIVHRIDKDTTGLLVVAKDDVTHRGLSQQFRDHSADRLYVALCWGTPQPDEGTVTTRIGRDPKERRRMASVGGGGGKVAVTHFRVAERYGPVSLVECSLDTGRTHQIRVHLSELGHPLVGDPVYGGTQPKRFPKDTSLRALLAPLHGQLLHAASLGFIHPISDEYVARRSPPHLSMWGVLRALRAQAGLDADAPWPWDREEPASFGHTDALVPWDDDADY